MTTETAAKKDIQKLQRAIVDGLEDVKAQDLVVFNTEHLSALFERVIIASGTSNRQTKALAASVRDAVREAGFPKPRMEGEDNGEWIIVDCGAAVVHIMQPAIRAYYTLEEIWGDKPVRLKFGAVKPEVAQPAAAPVAKKGAKKLPEPTLRRSSAAKTAVKQAEAARKMEPKAPSKRAPAKRVLANKATPAKAGAPAKRAAAPKPKPIIKIAPPKKAAARKATKK